MATGYSSITECFTYKVINCIEGRPNYTSIREINTKLNTNASSVHSNMAYGTYDLLALTVTPQVFNTLSTIPFVMPVNPGTIPPIIPSIT